VAAASVVEPDHTLPILQRVSQIVSSQLSLDEMLGEIVGLTVQVTQCDACLVYLIEPKSGEIVLRASQMPHARALGKIRMKPGEGIAGWVAENGSVVSLSSRASQDRRFRHFPALIEDTYEALLSLPIINGGGVIGVINVHHRLPREHPPDEVALFKFVGEQMGAAIARAMLSEEHARLVEENRGIQSQLSRGKVVEQYLLPERVARTDGAGPPLELAGHGGRVLLLTLEITAVIEHEGLTVSIWGSPDKIDWGTTPLLSFPERSYCGKYSAVLNLGSNPEISYIRAQWSMRRWPDREPNPLFGISVIASYAAS